MPRKSIESFHFGTRLEVTRYWLVSIFHHINERDNCRLPISAHTILLCLVIEQCIHHIMIFTGEKNLCCEKKRTNISGRYSNLEFLVRCCCSDYRHICRPLKQANVLLIFGFKSQQFSKMLMPNAIEKAFKKVDLPDSLFDGFPIEPTNRN